MIASVRGTVSTVGLDHLIVEVAGVGLLVHTTPATAAGFSSGAQAHLHTSMVVREESLTLYGFAHVDGQAIFEQVQTVSGVGPRLALAMLAVHQPDDVRRAITGGDLVALTKVPGIGKKGAERIVLELRDKVAPPAGAPGTQAAAASSIPSRHTHPQAAHVVQALEGLGWSSKQADEAVRAVEVRNAASDDPSAPMDVAALLRSALRDLGR